MIRTYIEFSSFCFFLTENPSPPSFVLSRSRLLDTKILKNSVQIAWNFNAGDDFPQKFVCLGIRCNNVNGRNDWKDKVGVLSLHSADSFRIPCDTFSTNIESRMWLHFWFSDFLEKYIFRHGFQLFLFSILLVARLKPWHEARLPGTCGCRQDTPFCSRGLDRLPSDYCLSITAFIYNNSDYSELGEQMVHMYR